MLVVKTTNCIVITHIDSSRMGRMLSGVYVSVCLYIVFPHGGSKSDAARITELDV